MTNDRVTRLTLGQLMGQTWQLLQKHPGLWNPPLVLNLLLALLAVNGGKGAAAFFPMAGAWLLTIAFRAGWLEQMSRVVQGEGSEAKATWGQFLEGVGHYFWRFLGGEVAQLALLGLGLAVAVSVGAQAVGWPDEAMIKEVLAAAKQSGDALQKLPAATLNRLNTWTLVLLGWAGYWGVLAVLLLFWQTYAVWSNHSWPKSWLASLGAVSRNLGVVVPLVMAQTLSYVFVFQLVVSGPGLLMMLGYVGYLLVWTFFSLASFLVVQRWEPHAPATPEHP